jgi:hypothetical protein
VPAIQCLLWSPPSVAMEVCAKGKACLLQPGLTLSEASHLFPPCYSLRTGWYSTQHCFQALMNCRERVRDGIAFLGTEGARSSDDRTNAGHAVSAAVPAESNASEESG